MGPEIRNEGTQAIILAMRLSVSVSGNHSELRAILNAAPALQFQIHAVLHPQDLTQQIPQTSQGFLHVVPVKGEKHAFRA